MILLEPYDEELRDLYLESLTALGKKEEAAAFSKETIVFFPENKKAISILGETSSFYSYLDSLNKEKETEKEPDAPLETEPGENPPIDNAESQV